MSGHRTPEKSMEPIAIVGMAGRFPGAPNLARYWENLREGVESIAFFGDQELAAAGVDPRTLRNPRYIRARGALADADLFDAVFFGLSPREAEIMDPQQRVFLETAWEALEAAGYASGGVALNAGVYAGASMNTYLISSALNNPEALLAAGAYQAMLANDKDFLATRVAYKLNLTGPAVTIQTACSTSLVAVQVACQGLITRQCDLALAGGVSVAVPRVGGYLYEPGMILSPDGHCRPFDARAQGTVPGEGVGIVVLKRLADAVADGDHIHAVIRGAAINNDGSLKVGYTAPSVDGQSSVIVRAHTLSGIDSASITYVEAHGTGTELGDPIEIAALTQAFGATTSQPGACSIGSVKSNIGHLDAAAGIAGLIKAVLALEHRTLPPSLHFSTPNPRIDFAAGPFKVNTSAIPWSPPAGAPRRAGVSSFGIGGTNAHVVLEEAPPAPPVVASRPAQLLTLSAKSGAALDRLSGALADHLAEHSELALSDVAYTLHRGRARFPHRRVVVARSSEEAARALRDAPGRTALGQVEAQGERPVAFLFSGQGSQYVDMGRGLYETEPIFREIVDAGADLLVPSLRLDLRTILYPARDAVAAARTRLATTALTQPALFLVEYALARLFMAWGIRPEAMLGHSIGEYVAACLSGVLELPDALRLVAERGRLMEVPGGAMLAVPLPEDELRAIRPADLSIAAVNGPGLCVVSGPRGDIAAFEATLASRGIRGQALQTAAAFHSAMMEPILEAFEAVVRGVRLGSPSIPYVSNVTGRWMTEADARDPGYWSRHLRHAVRFWDGLRELTRQSDAILLELGPGHTLASLAKPVSTRERPIQILSSLRHPNEPADDAVMLQTTLGRLWLGGASLDWAGYHANERRCRVPLPTYPFERERHWIAPTPGGLPALAAPTTLAKRTDVADWFYVPSWQRATGRGRTPEMPRDGWLLFADTHGLGAAIAARLRAHGSAVTIVSRGPEFQQVAENSFLVDPGRRDHHDRLLAELRSARVTPRCILHLWSLVSDPGSTATAARRDSDGFFSLFALAQALADQPVRDPLAIGVVVNGLHEVGGEALFRPGRMTVLGPVLAMPHELPDVSCRMIDVVLPETAAEAERLADRLLEEFGHPLEAPVVALRGRHRWVQRWQQIRLDAPAAGVGLRPGGVYVITGGLGGIGLVLARHLAERVNARLVLIGRTGLPPRTEWSARLTQPGEPRASVARLRAVLEIEKMGAEVLVVNADVADREQMADALDQARRRFGPIHGVIHAAGVLERGIIPLRTPEAAERVLAPKVAGTDILWGLLSGEEQLDFLLLCSSISTVVEGPGLADYRGANAFLDAFARSQASDARAPRVISMKLDSWQEVGIAARFGEELDVPDGISPAEGVQVFDRVLDSDVTEVVVSTRDLPGLVAVARRAVQDRGETPAEGGEAVGASSVSPGRSGLSTLFVAPTTDVERAIAQVWQELLGIEPLGIHDDFFEAGGHSLLATQVMSRIHQRLGVEVPLRTLFEARTLGAFAERVDALAHDANHDREEIEL